MTSIIYLFKDPLFSLYGVKLGTDALGDIAYNTALTRFKIHMLPFILYSFLDVGNGIARGLKKAISSTVITLIGTCALRVLWIMTVFRALGSLESIYYSYPISWLLTGIAQMILVIITIRKCKKTANATTIDE